MIGILCEKPSAARNFAKALGGMKGSYHNESYVITNARGHLYELADPTGQVDLSKVLRYKSWAVENLPWNEKDFQWVRVRKKDTASVLRNIKEVFKTCDEIVIAGDVDPYGEGFLLCAEVLQELKIRPKRLSRMYFMDETPKSIQDAFVKRKTVPVLEKDPEYLESWYRTRWDFLSMQFTRIATSFGDGRSVLRQGRLKSAMVSLVGDQLKLVAGYKKIPFYQNRFRDENGVVYTNPDEPAFPNKSQVPAGYQVSSVTIDSKSVKTTVPPKLLDLAGLSALLASKGFKAKEVLDAYQKLYEAAICSYPRTEDKTITPEQFNELLPLVDKIAGVVGVDVKLLTHRTPRKTHVKTGGAHGANRPGTNVPVSLSSLSSYGACAPHIYELLARSYLATLCEDYEYESQKGHVTSYPGFTGTASVPLKSGWKSVYHDTDDDAEDLSAKGLGTQASPFVHEGFPPKPAMPTMKWLMKQLEKHDVGTGATRTSTYSEVSNERSKYPLLIDNRGKIAMSSYGDMSYRLLPGTNIGSLQLTEQLQAEMRAISEGKMDSDACLHKIQEYVRQDVRTMEQNGLTMRKELGVTMNQGFAERYNGTWEGMPVSFKKSWGGHDFTDAECETLCNGGEVKIMGAVAKDGSHYNVAGSLAEQEFKGKSFVGFKVSRYLDENGNDKASSSGEDRLEGVWKGKPVRLKKVYCGHTFTQEEFDALCKGETITITDCKAKSGSTYGVQGRLNNLEYNGRKYIGFERLGFVDSGEPTIPKSWCKHEFTEDERILLEAGKEVRLMGCVSKKGSQFDVTVTWGQDESGKMCIIPDFSKK